MLMEQKLELTEQLNVFASQYLEVECCAIISTTGIMLAGYNVNWEAEDKFAAICTANFGLLSRSSRELGGKMQHFAVQIDGKGGPTILTGDGRRTIFTALCKSGSQPKEKLLSEIHQFIEDDQE
jgi:predicted regulator of Ras-like GTPase activity (Roadblock/LC7/MglB family)